jgi:hypothetical protein
MGLIVLHPLVQYRTIFHTQWWLPFLICAHNVLSFFRFRGVFVKYVVLNVHVT